MSTALVEPFPQVGVLMMRAYADLARVKDCTVTNLKKVASGEVAGGFVGVDDACAGLRSLQTGPMSKRPGARKRSPSSSSTWPRIC